MITHQRPSSSTPKQPAIDPVSALRNFGAEIAKGKMQAEQGMQIPEDQMALKRTHPDPLSNAHIPVQPDPQPVERPQFLMQRANNVGELQDTAKQKVIGGLLQEMTQKHAGLADARRQQFINAANS